MPNPAVWHTGGVDVTLLVVVAGMIGVLAVVAAFATTAMTKMKVAVVLALPQIMVPGLPLYLSGALIWILLCGVALMKEKRLGWTRVSVAIAAVGLVSLVASMWSSDLGLAVGTTLQAFAVLVVCVYVGSIRQSGLSLKPILRTLAFVSLIQSALVVLFRLSPEAEEAYWRSPAATVFLGASRLVNFFYGEGDNVSDPQKSGGIWLNANTASMFLGATAMLLAWGACIYRSRSLSFAAVLVWVAVFFTGSKTGLALALVLPIIGVIVGVVLGRAKGLLALPTALLAIPGVFVVSQLLVNLLPDSLVKESSITLGTRGIIWSTAASLFPDNWLLGLGFGGWDAKFYAASGGALGRSFPPHNVEVAAWSNGGIVLALAVVCLFIVVVAEGLRKVSASTGRRALGWSFATMGALWIMIHGQADVVEFFGDLRSLVVFGILLGVIAFEGGDLDAAPRGSDRAIGASRVKRKTKTLSLA